MSKKNGGRRPLVLPAIRAHMGDWIYYISFMRMRDIAERVSQAQLLYRSERLQELLQRQVLPGRATDIAHYLVTQEQRFFNALVIGTYGGSPFWREVKWSEGTTIGKARLPEDVEGVLGFLSLNGSEKLFTIDGQHRVEGMRLAVKIHPGIGKEEVSVILVKGITGESRTKDKVGFERTRRLFTTLNRYAKPVNKKDIIALDEDDSIAILTRRLVDEYPLFTGKKIAIKGTTSIPAGDKSSFTSINALYDGLDVFLRDEPSSKWKEFKRFYPSDKKIDEMYERARLLWETYCKYFPSLRAVKNSSPESETSGRFRTSEGGHLLFRPIGLLMSLKVVRNLMDSSGLSLNQAVKRISKMPMELSGEPWSRFLWNPNSKIMILVAANKNAALRLFLYGVGGDLTTLKSSPEGLRHDLSDILDIEDSEIRIRKYVH